VSICQAPTTLTIQRALHKKVLMARGVTPGRDTVFSHGSTNTEPGAVATGSNPQPGSALATFLLVEPMSRSLPLPVLILSTH
jgi:hypothetical protein